MKNSNRVIAIIGLGYVGLPLAVAFAKKYLVIGYDINLKRVKSLQNVKDDTLEVNSAELGDILSSEEKLDQSTQGLIITSNENLLKRANFFIITVPTPIDKYNRPVLLPMFKASETVARYLKKGDYVVYESTVYPGVTEEEMVPILEKESALKYNIDFFCGYSPERINPGDKKNTLTKILKITSGSTSEAADVIDELYQSIITAGTFKASSIKVAEAAKVIENAQRDINIAFVNELSKIFNLLKIDTSEVLKAAGTKWNFLKFRPGLVGGHCIGVDPYYLAQKAQEIGYHPEIILAGRRLNDSMGKYVATEMVRLMLRKDLKIHESKVLILGFTFKENCPDVRNTKVIDIYNEFLNYGILIDIYDPWVNPEDVREEYGISIFNNYTNIDIESYSGIVIAVAHHEFKSLQIQKSNHCVIYDVKGVLDSTKVDGRL